jgi:hypothetical protein
LVQHNGDVEILESQLSIADKYGVFQPVRFGVLALNSMVKFIAQMKNPRRGHDAQGKLKKVRIDESAEGYANYMAPMRVERIRVQTLPLPKTERDNIFSDDVLRPTTDTYLTPNWDEMIPFPMTWKIRFDGFGHSDYRVGDNPYGRVVPTWLPDSEPPFYQLQGASTTGGTFGDVRPECICAVAKAARTTESKDPKTGKAKDEKKDKDTDETHCPCLGESEHNKHEHASKTGQYSTGCGMGIHAAP